MALKNQLDEFQTSFRKQIPTDILQKMDNATSELAKSALIAHAPKVGDTLSDFTLGNQNGELKTLDALLSKGPLVITFYRGGWCPYCNLELKAYQDILGDINAAGATLVAITPELPDSSLCTIEKNTLGFEVLSDVDADYARSIGIVHSLAEELRPIYQSFSIHIEDYNGENQFDLPMAATFVIKQDKTIASAFVNADYTQRQEPNEVLEVLKSL